MIYLFGYTKTILFSKIENMPEMACQIFLNAKNALMDEMKSSIRKFLALTKMTRDEFADLIMTAGKEVETPIARIAQLARAGSNKKSEQYSRSRYSSKV